MKKPATKAEDHSETIRQMIQHENELMNDRLGWFFTLQGLLLAALGIAWDKPDSRHFINLLAVIGAVSSVSSCILTVSTRYAIDRLQTWWDEHRPTDYNGPDVMGGHSSAWRRKRRIPNLLMPWFMLPFLFIVAWCLIPQVAPNQSTSSTQAPSSASAAPTSPASTPVPKSVVSAPIPSPTPTPKTP